MTAPAPAPVKVAATAKSLYFLTLLLLTAAVTVVTSEKQPKFTTYTFGFPFNETYYTLFSVESPATISNNALQITPDSAGWCHKNRMLLLVYEYMPNGSLDKHIFCGEGKTSLSWKLRYQALSGVASALQYLHYEYDEKVIHRDLKASNILLDQHFNARLGDFGLARALDPEKTSYAEMEGVHGTMGYIAPECFHTGKATRESDVYGFGAVILEVACGLRPWTKQGGYQCLVDWVWSLHREQRILEAVDERLKKDYVAEDAERVLLLGLACSHPIATERPKTHAIVQILSGSVPAPHVPSFKPAFIWPSMGPLGDTSSEMTADTTPIPTSHFEPGWTPRSVSPHSGFTDRFMV